MTYAGELSAKFTWDGMQRSMKQFDNYIKAAERATGMSAKEMVAKTFQAASKMEGIMGRSSGKIAKLLQWSLKIDGVSRTKSELDSVEKKALSVGGVLGGLAIGATVKKGFDTAKSTGKFVLDSATEFESVIFGMNNVFGKQAPALIKSLQKMGADTPEEFTDLASNFTRLNAAGFTFNVDEFKKLADSAAFSNTKVSEVVDSMISLKRGQLAMVDNIYGQQAVESDGQIKLTAADVKTKKTVVSATLDKDNMDANAIKKFYLASAQRQGVAGMAVQLSKTLGGKQSTMGDNLKNMSFEFYQGFQTHIHSILDSTNKYLELITPKAKELGVVVGKYLGDFLKNLPVYMEKAKALLPFIVKGFGLFVLSIATMKAIGAGFAIAGMITKLLLLRSAFKFLMPVLLPMVKGAGGLFPLLAKWFGRMLISGMLVSGVVIGIGTAIAALGYLGYRLYLYFTKGSQSLDDLRVKFPWLADSIQSTGDYLKKWWPHLKVAGLMIKDLLIGNTNSLAAVVKWAFFKVIVPVFQLWIEHMARCFDMIRVAYEFYMPTLVRQFYLIKDTWRDIWEFMQPGLKELWDWLSKIGGVAGDAFRLAAKLLGLNSGDDGGNGAAGGVTSNSRGVFQVNGQTLVKNNDLANRLVAVGDDMYSGAKQCLRGVWMTQQAVMKGTSVIKSTKAYMAADELARDKRFKEIKITPEMFRAAMAGDKQMQELLHGANVIYDRSAGFSPTAGHAEIWDMNRKKALYGMGPASLQRSDQMIQHARAFIPAGQQTVTIPARTGSGGGGGVGGGAVVGPQITQTINVQSKSADPKTVAREVAQKTSNATASALRDSTAGIPKPGRKN